jgi:hypothetical protein
MYIAKCILLFTGQHGIALGEVRANSYYAFQKNPLFRKVPLKRTKPTDDSMEKDRKWKLILNQKNEMDEL